MESYINTDEATKSRIVSFRVSQKEYEVLEQASQRGGFRNVSFYARSSALPVESVEPARSPFDTELTRLWRRLEALTEALETIVAKAGLVLSSSKSKLGL